VGDTSPDNTGNAGKTIKALMRYTGVVAVGGRYCSMNKQGAGCLGQASNKQITCLRSSGMCCCLLKHHMCTLNQLQCCYSIHHYNHQVGHCWHTKNGELECPTIHVHKLFTKTGVLHRLHMHTHTQTLSTYQGYDSAYPGVKGLFITRCIGAW
jgi:hypothetical protein